MGGASGESSRGGSPRPIKGRSSSEFGAEAGEEASVGEVESQCVCRSWRSERRSGHRGEAASRGESRRRGEEGQSEALGTTVDGTAVEFGGPGERP